MRKIEPSEVDLLLKLYEFYDRRRQAILWFLGALDAKNLEEYNKKYTITSEERVYFTSVCGFFELSGVLVKRRLIRHDLFFDIFNPSPYWARARRIVEGMRRERPHIYENFELLTDLREEWSKKRPARKRKVS